MEEVATEVQDIIEEHMDSDSDYDWDDARNWQQNLRGALQHLKSRRVA